MTLTLCGFAMGSWVLGARPGGDRPRLDRLVAAEPPPGLVVDGELGLGVAGDPGVPHAAGLRQVERRGAMHEPAVVPHDGVADLPPVEVDPTVLARPGVELVEETLRLAGSMPTMP